MYNVTYCTEEKMYLITYHYMHYIPSMIVRMLVPESLLEHTRNILASDRYILIDDIEEIESVI